MLASSQFKIMVAYNLNDIYNSEGELNKVYLKIDEMFNLNVDKQLNDLNYRFENFHEIIDLVNNTKYYCIGIENIDLYFQDRNGLFEELIKFIDKEITNIPGELAHLESQRSSRDFDDNRHFIETETLSERQGKLDKLKTTFLINRFKKDR